jgi:predicted ATPase/RsiW-degrading membrane proteinase PrsW (M82 family)
MFATNTQETERGAGIFRIGTMIALLNNPGFYVSYAVIQAIVVLLAIRFLDLYQREPLGILALMAFWGATGAALLALIGNSVVRGLLSGDAQEVFGNAISAPLVEESAKGLALLVAIGPLRWIAHRFGVTIFGGGLTEGIVYGAAVGVGFAFTEDFFYFVDQARANGLNQGVDVFLTRRDFFGPAVLHHPLFTAAFGAGLGLAAWSANRWGKILYPLAGFVIAVSMHAVNNGLVESVLTLKYGLFQAAQYVRGEPVLANVSQTASSLNTVLRLLDFYYVVLFVGVMALWLRYQRKIIHGELKEEVSSGLLSHDDWLSLTRYWERSERYWTLFRTGQLEQWRHQRRVHNELTRLALLKWRTRRSGDDWQPVQRLRREIATLSTYDVREGNIPEPATPLVGRDRELSEMQELLGSAGVRLVTLTGPGGTGKTRLSIELAHRLRDSFPSGVFFVPLAAIRDSALVPSALAETLGVAEREGELPLETLKDYLRDKQLLLVLDNLEQVTSAAPQLAELLETAPRVRMLATSREVLRIQGEHEYPLPPLLVPDESADVEAAEKSGAVALFVERARAADPGFTLGRENAPQVIQICRRLEGLPLAIELAAARIRLLSPTELLERLERPLGVLVEGAAELPERHRALHETIAWSYELLDDEDRALFTRLAVFVDGAELDAAELVCGGPAIGNVLERSASLVEKSLVRRGGREGRARVEMLETIREFASERLEERGETERLRRRHAEWYVELAEQSEPALLGPEQAAWLERLSAESANIRTALEWSVAAGEVEVGLRLAGALVRFWSARGLMGEGRRWLADALEAGGAVAPKVRAKALFAAGYAAIGQGDFAEARSQFELCLERARELEDARLEAAALAQLGWLAFARGERDAAVQQAGRALELAREADDRVTASGALSVLAEAAALDDDVHAAELFEESLALRRDQGDGRLVANSLLNLGRLELARGRAQQARGRLEEALALAREIGDTWGMSVALVNLGRVRLREDEDAEAGELFSEGLRLARERGDKRVVAECLQGLAVVSLDRDEPAQAARLWAAGEAILQTVGAEPSALERALEEEFLPRLGVAVTKEELAAESAAGRSLSADEAIAAALERGP